MAAAQARAPLPAHRVDLVDEYNRRSVLLGLVEQVPDPGRAHANIELHKVGARDGQKVDPGLSGHRLGNQRFAGARRAHQKYPLGNPRPQGRVLLGIAHKVHNLPQLLLFLVGSGHVVKGHPDALVGECFGPGVAKAGGAPASAAGSAALALVGHIPEARHSGNQQQIGQIGKPGGLNPARVVVVGGNHSPGSLLVNHLVQIIVKHPKIRQVVADGVLGIPFSPDGHGEHIVLHPELGHPLLQKEGADLAVGIAGGLIHPLQSPEGEHQNQSQQQVEGQIPIESSH